MAMSNCRKSSAATTSASAAPGADFKTCCMPSGRFDGSDRDDYFQGVMPPFPAPSFSPRGRRWQREALTDEGSAAARALIPCRTFSPEGRRRQPYPRPPHRPHTPLAHHPNGAAIRRYAGGWVTVRRLRVESRSTPGRLRGTAESRRLRRRLPLKVMQTAQACLNGVLRPLCEELAGTVASHHAFVPCRTARQPDEGNWRPRARGDSWLSTR